MVIAIPLLLLIKRDEKQIGALQLVQVSLAAWLVDDRIAQ